MKDTARTPEMGTGWGPHVVHDHEQPKPPYLVHGSHRSTCVPTSMFYRLKRRAFGLELAVVSQAPIAAGPAENRTPRGSTRRRHRRRNRGRP